jgi:hypothetical protein
MLDLLAIAAFAAFAGAAKANSPEEKIDAARERAMKGEISKEQFFKEVDKQRDRIVAQWDRDDVMPRTPANVAKMFQNGLDDKGIDNLRKEGKIDHRTAEQLKDMRMWTDWDYKILS